VIFASLPLLFTYLVYSTFLRGVGDSQTPFYFLIVSTALTMVLTPFLIGGWFGFRRLGVVGPAWGNVVATAVALAAMLVTLRVRHNPLAPDRAILANLIPRGKIVGQLLRIGIPTGIQLVTVSLAEVAVVVFVNHYGSDATAAYGAVNQIVSYVQFPAISLGIAASIFGAQTIGAKRSDRLRAIVRAAVVLCWVIEGILIVTAYVFSEQILSLFLTSPQTRGIAHGLLSITLWSYVIFGTSSVLSGVMRSSGAVLWPTTITVCAIWLVEVPVAYVLSYHTPLALSGVWYGYPAAFIVSLLGQTLYYNLVWKRTLPTAIT
jgi:putative MATE family efflux protein